MRCSLPSFAAHRRGFTLMDTALATIIVGVGIMAVMQLLATGTTMNYDGAQQTTGVNLAKNIRELCLNLAFTDPNNPGSWGQNASQYSASPSSISGLNELTGTTFSPPIDSRKSAIAGWTDWQQSVTVQTVDPNRLSLAVPNGTQPAVRITVNISHKGANVYTMSWYAFDATP